MRIKLDDTWTLDSDEREYKLKKNFYLDEKGHENYDLAKYFRHLDEALKGYCEIALRKCDATSFEEVGEKLEELRKEIEEIKLTIRGKTIREKREEARE